MLRLMPLTGLLLLGCGEPQDDRDTEAPADTDKDTDTDTSAPPETSAHDVIVVGAGSAGLYATKTLLEEGYEVLLIEASDRIGGRVKSATLGDMRVELGAEEHYLSRGENPVYPAIRDEFGESIYVAGYQGLDAYSMDGGTRTCWTKPEASIPCQGDSDVSQVDSFWSWYWRPSNHPDATLSLAQAVEEQFGVGVGHRAYHLYDAGIAGGSYATNLTQLGGRSLAIQSSSWDLSGDIRVLADKDLGYSDALETIWWDDVVAKSELLLERPVVGINTEGDAVVVQDATGATHSAHQVIVTVSIGVLQAEVIDFTPDLPEATVDAYNGIGMDMGMKVALQFNSPWWETENDPLAWLVTEGLAGACWVPSDYKIGSISHILMCYPMGTNARTLNDLAIAAGGGEEGDTAIVTAILNDLDRTFPQAEGQASLTHQGSLVQNWGADPYTLGAYSYPQVGTYTSSNDSKRHTLRGPVANNRIFFAGEGTHPTHPSTVPGALHEGERAAKEVHSVNGSPGNPPARP